MDCASHCVSEEGCLSTPKERAADGLGDMLMCLGNSHERIRCAEEDRDRGVDVRKELEQAMDILENELYWV